MERSIDIFLLTQGSFSLFLTKLCNEEGGILKSRFGGSPRTFANLSLHLIGKMFSVLSLQSLLFPQFCRLGITNQTHP